MHIYYPKLRSLLKPESIKKYKYYLVYGPEESAKQMAKNYIIEAYLNVYGKDSAEINTVAYESIKGDTDALVECVQGQSLFSSVTLSVIENCESNLTSQILKYIKDKETGDNIVVFMGNELKKTSATYKQFFNSPNALAIACYAPQERDFRQMILNNLASYNVKPTPDVVNALMQTIPHNEMILRKEIEKILLYNSSNTITIEDIAALVPEAQEFSLDSLCNSIVTCDREGLVKNIARIKSTHTNYMLVLRVLQQFFSKVVQVIDSSSTPERAVAELKPPVFFKQRDNLIAAAKSLSLVQARKASHELIKLEIKCKSGLAGADLELQHGLLRIFSICSSKLSTRQGR